MLNSRAFPKRASGFTLVELLVAVVLLSVGALGAVTMQRTAVKANQAAYTTEVATSLARQILEATKNLPYDDTRLAATGGNWNTVPVNLSMSAPAFYTRHWQIADSAAATPTNHAQKTIRVRVRWNQAEQTREVILSSIKAQD